MLANRFIAQAQVGDLWPPLARIPVQDDHNEYIGGQKGHFAADPLQHRFAPSRSVPLRAASGRVNPAPLTCLLLLFTPGLMLMPLCAVGYS
jgi:hypothetical protein